MNNRRRVFQLIAIFTASFFLISFLQASLNLPWHILQRVNLLADITKNKKEYQEDSILTPIVIIDSNDTKTINKKEFSLYTKPGLITDFNIDTLQPALNILAKGLNDLKTGKKKKIRIAYFGDSMIEGDLISQTLRKLLQKEFGGSGVGFVPITSTVANFRTTVSDNFSENWTDENFKNNSSQKKLYISGHTFFAGDASYVQMSDKTVANKKIVLEKSFLCGYLPGNINLSVDNVDLKINAAQAVNRIVVSSDSLPSVKLALSNKDLPAYGISFETAIGIFVDNFSFRGISGAELANIDASVLNSINQNNPYDLIIFQYGTNLLFRPNDKNYSWYYKIMKPAIKHFKSAFPQTDFLIICSADRAFRYDDGYKTATGIDSLIKIQAMLAYENDCSFYNQYQTMGGNGTIVSWVTANPPLANKDYIHPNFRGAEILGNHLYNALMKDYKKYEAAINNTHH